MRARRHLAFALVTLLTSGCLSSGRPPATVAAAPPPAAGVAAPLDAVTWVERSAEYEGLIAQAYRTLTTRVDRESATRAAGSWAVVFDADETLISNLPYQVARRRLGYSEESWAAWVRERAATPLPGAADLLAHIRARGGRIAVVTNRFVSQCNDTEAVFRAHALAYDAMLCRPDGTPSDKNPRFRAIAAGQASAGATPLEIVAFVGDNILDFPDLSQAVKDQPSPAFDDFGSRFILLPNPMYGSWQ